MGLKNQGAGMPDGGMFTESQYATRRDVEPLPGQMPERGVIEVKPVGTDMKKLATSKQVTGYWAKYRLVLVTDLREFVLLGEESGKTVVRERYALAATGKEFWILAQNPGKAAEDIGQRFVEFLQRVMLHAAPLVDPKDLAWFLASYAREARARVEASNLPALVALRSALEQALGVKFEGVKGEHFFRSTLVQTLFYGVFAAWVLWYRAGGKGRFEWHNAAWSLHVPMIRSLFEQLAVPTKLRPLGLEEPLDLAAAALNRVSQSEFFKRFEDRHAVQYFYEPFLEAFDPELRTQLGVWYTPEEIVRYMVRRVDQVLVSELGIADGLADPQVYVLDPCCGTGAYLVETLAVIGERLKAKGGDALGAQRLKKAMTERIFGFEILPAPFVISHLQIGLLLADLGVPLGEDERAGVYLTNALTGWEPPKGAKQHFVFPELEAEREAAEVVKRDTPILVMLGNPPYNAFAGVAQGEEQDLVERYKRGLQDWGITGRINLDDLFVRFVRLGERQIAERQGRGIVCYITNYVYLAEPSFVTMRDRLHRQFDRIWIDCMNGDSRDTGKLTPTGDPDPSVFSTAYNREGIRKGTAIGLFVRSSNHSDSVRAQVKFRNFWGVTKRADLVSSLEAPNFDALYGSAAPTKENSLSFKPQQNASTEYVAWPRLTDLCGHAPIYGLNENRRGAMISIDRDSLIERMRGYLDSNVSNHEAEILVPALMRKAARFDPLKCRMLALAHHVFDEANVRRFAANPFDVVWCYWSPLRPMWNEPRPDLVAQHWPGNSFLHVRRFGRRPDERIPIYFGTALPDLHLMDPDVVSIPLQWRSTILGQDTTNANLSQSARAYLASLGVSDPEANPDEAKAIWLHALAICYSGAWLSENSDAIRTGFPRVPLPATLPQLRESAVLGARVAALLDPDVAVVGVTAGAIENELGSIAAISHSGGGAIDPGKGELALSAGWGFAGREGATMAGKGRIEIHAAPALPRELGATRYDLYLNDVAYWANVPDKVWNYTIGGYQVMKKWLSYRDRSVLGRDLTMDEIDDFTRIARRIAAILLMSDALDANFLACKTDTWPWPQQAGAPTVLDEVA